ncbi:MAG: hypothetical protein KJS68_10865, partial [Alphaproteobacteria bacterium]|nr:hypothetical protein [Alphaproteobacteria bacterium]
YLDEAAGEKYLPRWYALIEAVLSARAPLRMLSRSDAFDKSYLTGEFLGAPLRADDDTVKLVLAMGHYDGTRSWTDVATEECRRLGLEPLGIL